jgi:hypothetical protein
VQSEKNWGFESDGDGAWKIFNGVCGKTITCVLGGTAGYKATIAYGYWDTAAVDPETGKMGVWVNDETTALGSHVFDTNGEVALQLDIPKSAVNVVLHVYYYAVYDEETKSNIVHDKGEVSLEKITVEN